MYDRRDLPNSHYEKFTLTGEIKCIDDEIPFDLPKDWEWCRLGDVADYRKGPFGSSLTKSMFVPYSSSSIKVYEQKNAIQKDFSLGEYYITEEKFNEMKAFRVSPNDIIVSCAGTIGETYILPMNAPIGVINQALMRVSLFEQSMSEYWQWLFEYVMVGDTLMKGAGSAIKNIPPFEYLKNILTPLPPLAEQQRIVAKIEELMSLVEQYGKAQSELEALNSNIREQLKKSVLQYAIEGKLVPQCEEDDTAEDLLREIQAEKQRLYAEGKLKKKDLAHSTIFRGEDNKYFEKVGNQIICIDNEIPFDAPQGWEWTRLSAVSDIYTGNSISETEKRTKYTNVTGRYYIGTKDVDFNNNITYNNGVEIPKKYERNFRIAPSNSVLMCIEGGSAGRKIAVLNQDICFGNKLCCFTPFINITRYIFYYLQSPLFLDIFNENKTGIIGGVSIAKVKDILIPLPPHQEIERIVNKIDNVAASIMSR